MLNRLDHRRGRRLLALLIMTLAAGCGGNDASAPIRTLASLNAVAGEDQSGAAGGALAESPTVEARDEDGAPMAGVSVRFTVTSGGGALSDTLVTTDGQGRASTTWLLGPEGGSAQMIRATAGTIGTDFSAEATTPQAGQSYFGRNSYVEYIAGDLPIIITAPHGGSLVPSEIPDRTGTDVTTVRDTNTEELARTIGNVFDNRAGGRPHIIIMRLRRTKIDANRDIGEAVKGNRLAGRAWIEFHAFIEAAKAAVIAEHGTGFYIDLHGHGHAIPRLELGYLLSSPTLALSDAEIDAIYEDSSSIRTLSHRSPTTFAEILRGSASLGALFADEGYASVPSPAAPNSVGAEYFAGGYNTERHGSRDGGPISGLQIETHFAGVRDNQASWERFAEALVDVMDAYMAHHGAAPATAPRSGSAAR
jgi:hypothetical protein